MMLFAASVMPKMGKGFCSMALVPYIPDTTPQLPPWKRRGSLAILESGNMQLKQFSEYRAAVRADEADPC